MACAWNRKLIGRFASDNQEERLLVGLEQVPQLLQQTLLLVEDRDFLSSLGRQTDLNHACGTGEFGCRPHSARR